MAHLTHDFTSEAPLTESVREAIAAAFDQGWADPKKLSQSSGKAAALREAALNEIATHLRVRLSDLEVVGEPALLPYLSLVGFTRSDTKLYTGTIDVGKIRAIARAHQGESEEVGVDHHGALLRSGLKLNAHTLLSLQATNGETGISQELEGWRDCAGRVVVDATNVLPGADYVTGFSATTFDATSWGGPRGVGFLAITDAKSYKYPLPHIAPIRTPGSYSLPLLIGSAFALRETLARVDEIVRVRNYCAEKLSNISGLTVLGPTAVVASGHLSAVIDEISAEEFLRTLLTRDYVVDAGSACNPEDLKPSHVVAAMGFPTPGHLRISVHAGQSEKDVDLLVHEVAEVLTLLRS